MEDRELLELAAKAAGIAVIRSRLGDSLWEDFLLRDVNGDGIGWNPLTDDGDALRLAVKLGLFLELFTDEACMKGREASVTARGYIDSIGFQTDIDELWRYDFDPYAATRRAIVRAAAEIGKQMTDLPPA
ncbi:hypothetical protein [Bordetella petrii]|nr:hypothetical protein [Bordetella petrii]